MQDKTTKMIDALLGAVDGPLSSLAARIKELENRKLEKGEVGVGLAGALIDRSGNLIVTLSDGKIVDLGEVIGKDADLEEVKRFIDETVTAEISKIELPTVDLEEVKRSILEALPEPVNGKDGIDGKDGDSVSEETVKALVDSVVTAEISKIELPTVDMEAVKSLIVDNVADAVSKLPVPKDGKDADLEEVKRFIDETVTAEISKIPEAKDGIDGRDGLDIEILDGIDFNRSYNRNSYAELNGGLWRSFEKTQGSKGWACIVDGIKDIEIVQKDERNFSIRIEKSSGSVVENTFIIPAILDKGVFSEGTTYQKGDAVSFGGSLFIAQTETTSKPATDRTWRLSAKKGRDGKDGIVKQIPQNAVVKTRE